MKLSAQGAAFLRGHEGFVSKWYRDPVGILTIGVGFTWRSESFKKWWKKHKPGSIGQGSMTRFEADDALKYLCDTEYGLAVNRFLGKKVAQHVFDGMVSMVYNLGPGALKWKWAAACKRGNYAAAAALVRRTGTTAKGIRLPGLVRRRKEEALLISNGIYTGERVLVIDAMADGVLRRRERGSAVAALIRDLKTLGYYSGPIDDLFGPSTEAAVMQFQHISGLQSDGIAGPKTLKMIAAALRTPARIAAKPRRKATGGWIGFIMVVLTGIAAAIGKAIGLW